MKRALIFKCVILATLVFSVAEMVAIIGKLTSSEFVFTDTAEYILRSVHLLLCAALAVIVTLYKKLGSAPSDAASQTAGEMKAEINAFGASPLLWSSFIRSAAIILLILVRSLLSLELFSVGGIPYRLICSCAVICQGAEILFTLLCAVFASVILYFISENKEKEEEKDIE